MRRIALVVFLIAGVIAPLAAGPAEASPFQPLAKRLVSISIEVPGQLYTGYPRQLRAIGTYRDGSTADLTSAARWKTTDRRVAAVSNKKSARGLVNPRKVGSAVILARVGRVRTRTHVKVLAAPPVVLDIAPVSGRIPAGRTAQYAATVWYRDLGGLIVDVTSTALWQSNAFNAMVSNAGGSRGLVTAISVGTVEISATFEDLSTSVTLTVTPAAIDQIEVTPVSPRRPRGVPIELIATATYSDGSHQDVTELARWTTANPSVATVSNTAGSRGRAIGVSAGSVQISASLDGVSGNTSLTVTNATLVAISLAPSSPTVALGETTYLSAVGTYSDGDSFDISTVATWSTSNAAVASIAGSGALGGVVTAAGCGSTTITATLNSVAGSTVMTVNGC